MKKKKLLQTKPYSIRVYGISSPEKGYKLAWSLGNVFNLTFKRQDGTDFQHQFDHIAYELFASQNDDYEKLLLLRNEKEGKWFLPKYKIADFFIIQYLDGAKSEIKDIINKARSLDSIQAVFEINFKSEAEESMFYVDQ